MTYFSKKYTCDFEFIKVISIYENILVCHPNKLLQQDVFVSLFLNVNSFEKQIGYGYVSHIQGENIIQITVSEFCNDFSLNELSHQPVRNIIIRPTVTISYINHKLEKEYQSHETNTSSLHNQ